MSDTAFDEFLFDGDEGVFDPLSEDFEPAEAAEEDGIVDLPVMAEMPSDLKPKSVFDKERFASAQDAIEELLTRNPGRKPVLLQIIEFCCEERAGEEVAELVEQAQAENRSVYTPQSLCSILERAGALTGRSEAPEQPEADEDADSDAQAEQVETAATDAEQPEVEVREVAPQPTTYWLATDDGLTVVASHKEGHALEELLASESEAPYLEIYERVLAFCAAEPRKKPQIDALVDDDPLVQNPRRYSNHFIELLENREALSWHDGGWNATELGRRYLEEHGLLAG